MLRSIKLLILFSFLLLGIAISLSVKASVTISNVSPADGAKHVDIQSNPPDPEEPAAWSSGNHPAPKGGRSEKGRGASVSIGEWRYYRDHRWRWA